MGEPTSTRMHVAGASPYDVLVGTDLLGQLPAMLGDDVRRVALCHPEGLADLAERVAAILGDVEVLHLALPDGEAAKTAAVAVDAWEQLGRAGFTRSDAVVTLGGGATTDMGGFIAATWLRGVPVVHVPTTLLGMVDAAVGGKTGMNTSAGKNLVGSFHEPAGVICDLDLLVSLPTAELVSGLGEVVKCGFIADPEILRIVEESPEAVLDPRSPELREVVERAIRVKIDVVVGDLKEAGGAGGAPGREMLNYGHTMAHAIERGTDYRVRHGEAVALGMVYVAEVARLAGRLDSTTAARHATALASVGLPTSLSDSGAEDLAFADLLATMRVDKKARGAQLRFLVLDGLAEPSILAGPDESILRAAYDHLVGGSLVNVLVLNGPNLGRLGRRQPEIYGTTTHADLARLCQEWGRDLGLEVELRQTNHEGQLLDWLNQAADESTPVVLNAGAWSHYSYALLDACAQLVAPLVEVHISDPKARPEEFRHHSVITAFAAHEIVGQGIDGYRQALELLAAR